MANIIFSVTAIVVYFIVAHFLIEFFMKCLWKRIEEKRNPVILTATIGFIDRIIYALSFAFKAYAFIGIWLSIKIVSRLVGYATTKENNLEEWGKRRNIYLIGNIFALILGLGGGFLIKFLFNTQVANLLEFLE